MIDPILLLHRGWMNTHFDRIRNTIVCSFQRWTLSLAKTLALPVEEGFIETGGVLWKLIQHLLLMGNGSDLLKASESFIPCAKHYTVKTFNAQIEARNSRYRHYPARLQNTLPK